MQRTQDIGPYPSEVTAVSWVASTSDSPVGTAPTGGVSAVARVIPGVEILHRKRSDRRHLRHVLPGGRPMEVRRVAGQDDAAPGG
jgi:hypothetical protein